MSLLSALCDDPADLVRMLLLAIAALLLITVWLTVCLVDHAVPRDGDPMQSPFGDVPFGDMPAPRSGEGPR